MTANVIVLNGGSSSGKTAMAQAIRAHLLEMAGELDAAFAEYKTAANRTTDLPERDYLTIKAARVNQRRSQSRVS